jgi:hypothetical protein
MGLDPFLANGRKNPGIGRIDPRSWHDVSTIRPHDDEYHGGPYPLSPNPGKLKGMTTCPLGNGIRKQGRISITIRDTLDLDKDLSFRARQDKVDSGTLSVGDLPSQFRII